MKREPVVLVTREQLHRLVEASVATSNPPWHRSCDWLRNPLALGLTLWPLCVYEKIRSLQHGSRSRVE